MTTIPKRQRLRRALIIGSFVLFPITIFYFSPALVVMGASKGILAGSGIVFVAQFISALLLGRAFCGWVCPGAGLQEACFIAQSKPVAGSKCDWIKYVIWAPWIGMILCLFAKKGVHAADFFFMMDSPISLSSPPHYVVYLVVTGIILILSLTIGKRGFCHTACWMAPFMILGTRVQALLRLPALHLRVKPSQCVDCQQCAHDCSMSLDVPALVRAGNMAHSECVLCGNCVDACKSQCIRFSFGRKGKAEQ